MHGDSRIPPELLSPKPRAVRARPGRLQRVRFIQLLGLLLILGGAGLIWAAVRNPLSLRYGRSVDATVIEVTAFNDKTDRDNDIHYSYSIDGSQFYDSQQVTSTEGSAAHAGSVLPIKSLNVLLFRTSTPTGPGHTNDRAIAWGVSGVGAFVLLLAYGILSMQHRQKRLLRDGDVAIGIVSHKNKSRDHDGGITRFVRYEFAPPGLGLSKGKALNVRQADYEAVGVGSHLAIVYNPNHPSRNVAYKLVDFEVAG